MRATSICDAALPVGAEELLRRIEAKGASDEAAVGGIPASDLDLNNIESLLLAVSLAFHAHIGPNGAADPGELRCSHFRVFDDDVPGEELPES